MSNTAYRMRVDRLGTFVFPEGVDRDEAMSLFYEALGAARAMTDTEDPEEFTQVWDEEIIRVFGEHGAVRESGVAP